MQITQEWQSEDAVGVTQIITFKNGSFPSFSGIIKASHYHNSPASFTCYYSSFFLGSGSAFPTKIVINYLPQQVEHEK